MRVSGVGANYFSSAAPDPGQAPSAANGVNAVHQQPAALSENLTTRRDGDVFIASDSLQELDAILGIPPGALDFRSGGLQPVNISSDPVLASHAAGIAVAAQLAKEDAFEDNARKTRAKDAEEERQAESTRVNSLTGSAGTDGRPRHQFPQDWYLDPTKK